MDALLVFDCMIYLNVYYYFMFTIANLAIWVAKNTSEDYDTPYIVRDAYVAAGLTLSELFKLVLFRRFREKYRGWSVFVTVAFTVVSAVALLYVFVVQRPVLKLELCLDIMLFALLCGEILYGIYSFLPCCREQDIYK